MGVGGWVVVAVIGLLMVSQVIEQGKRAGATIKDQRKCAFCRARLKKNVGGKTAFAGVCAKCGRTQPWAQAAG